MKILTRKRNRLNELAQYTIAAAYVEHAFARPMLASYILVTRIHVHRTLLNTKKGKKGTEEKKTRKEIHQTTTHTVHGLNIIKERKTFKKMNKKVGMLLQKSTDTRGVGISSMRKSIYLLKTTPSSHTHRFHPLPLATPTSCSPHLLATPIHSTHSPQLSSIL